MTKQRKRYETFELITRDSLGYKALKLLRKPLCTKHIYLRHNIQNEPTNEKEE